MNLVRANVDRDKIPILGHSNGARNSILSKDPSVVIIPFLYSLDDATFRRVDLADTLEAHYFDIVHDPDKKGALEARIRSVVSAIRESNANVAILPELALNQDLLLGLRAELSRTDSLDSPLDWVIAGSYRQSGSEFGGFHVFNSAFVLDSSGSIVRSSFAGDISHQWIQSKRHKYKLSAEEQRMYNLSGLLGGVDRTEAINIGQQLYVFETRMGRFAVMICEDWARDEDTCDLLRQINCRVVFVVVMDGLLLAQRWAAKRAGFIGDETGVYAVVANSLLLPLRDSRTDPSVPQPVGLLLLPQNEPKSMKAATQPTGDVGSLRSEPQSIPLSARRPLISMV